MFVVGMLIAEPFARGSGEALGQHQQPSMPAIAAVLDAADSAHATLEASNRIAPDPQLNQAISRIHASADSVRDLVRQYSRAASAGELAWLAEQLGAVLPSLSDRTKEGMDLLARQVVVVAPRASLPDANAGITRQLTLSPQEQLAQTDGFLSVMQGARENMRLALEKARLQRDIVKTLCLNDKMNQTDVAIRSARERKDSLGTAVQRSNGDLANHEFTILGVLRQRVAALSAEAKQCIGEEAGFVGESAVSFTVDPGMAPDLSTFADQVGSIIVEPPSCTSCVK